jgi:hypothetical protein
MVWGKVEGFGEVRAGGPDETKTEGFGPNQPGPSGFRLAGARFVEPLGRCTTSTFGSPAGSHSPNEKQNDSVRG